MNEIYRSRIEKEMRIRGLSVETIECYVSCLKLFMNHFKGKKPTTLTLSDMKNYCLILVKRGQSNRYINMQMSSIRFFFKNVCKARFNIADIPRLPEPRKLPVILSREEVKQILNAASNPKHRAMMILLYGTGIRINELINIKVSDIDSKAGTLFIATGKGTRQRHVTLSPMVLAELRKYWKLCKPRSVWLFAGKEKNRISRSDYPSAIFRRIKNKCGIKTRGSCHLMRHSFASHSLENGVDIRTLQLLLGHADIESTCIYAHVSKKYISQIQSPFDLL